MYSIPLTAGECSALRSWANPKKPFDWSLLLFMAYVLVEEKVASIQKSQRCRPMSQRWPVTLSMAGRVVWPAPGSRTQSRQPPSRIRPWCLGLPFGPPASSRLLAMSGAATLCNLQTRSSHSTSTSSRSTTHAPQASAPASWVWLCASGCW